MGDMGNKRTVEIDSKLIADLLDEVNGADAELFAPDEPVGTDERVIGTVTGYVRKLYSAGQVYYRDYKRLKVELEFDKASELSKRYALAYSKHEALLSLFWLAARSELNVLSHETGVGIREHWVLVEVSRNHRVKKMFEQMFGEGSDVEGQ